MLTTTASDHMHFRTTGFLSADGVRAEAIAPAASSL